MWPTVLDTSARRTRCSARSSATRGRSSSTATASCSRSAGRGVPAAQGRGAREPRARSARRVRRVTGHALTLSYELREGDGPAPPAPLSEDELVARLMDEFDAEVLGEHRRGGALMPQPNMQQMLKQVQKMQADMARAQEELAAAEVEASAGGGMVTVARDRRARRQGDPHRSRGDRPRRPGAARRHGARGRQRGAARGAGAGRQKMGGATAGLDIGALRGLGLPGLLSYAAADPAPRHRALEAARDR